MVEKKPYISSRFDVSKEARRKAEELSRQTGIPMFRLVNEHILGLTDKGVDTAIKAFEPGKMLQEKITDFNRQRTNEIKVLLEDIKSTGSGLPKDLKKDIEQLIKG